MRLSKNDFGRLVALLLIFTLIISSCSQKMGLDESTSAPDPTSGNKPSQDHIYIDISAIPDFVDPAHPNTSVSKIIARLCFPIFSDLVESENLENGVVEYGLKMGALDAEDIKFNLDRLVGYYGFYSEFTSKIEEVTVISSQKIRIKYNDSIDNMELNLPIAPLEYFESGQTETGNFGGLYSIVEYNATGNLVMLEAANSMTGGGVYADPKPEFNKISLIKSDSENIRKYFTDGFVDIVKIPRDREYLNWAKKQDGFVLTDVNPVSHMVGFGSGIDFRIRQLVYEGLDVNEFIYSELQNSGKLIDKPYTSVGEMRAYGYGERKYNEVRARELAQQAFEQGLRSIDYIVNIESDISYLLALAVQKDLQKLGIKVNLHFTSFNNMIAILQEDPKDLVWGFGWDLLNGIRMPNLFYDPANNFFDFKNTEINKLFAKLHDLGADGNSIESKDIKDIYDQSYEILAEQLPVVPVVITYDQYLVSHRISRDFLELIFDN